MEGASTLISTEDGKDRGRVDAGGDVETTAATDDNAYLRKISEGRKDLLLAVFSLGMFMDILGFSVFFIMVGPLASDLDIPTERQTWVITSFGVTFASCLLFWGRVCDLFSSKHVFCIGFMGLGSTNLVISFLQDQYSFFVFRAISGVFASCLLPASFRLIVSIMDRHQLSRAFTVYGISGAIANSMGVILGGVVLLIPGSGQMTAWRWYFRIVGIIILPVALSSFYLVPSQPASAVSNKITKLDLVGVLTSLLGLILLTLSLTMGASRGFQSASFIAPFTISIALLIVFAWWESRLPTESALLPPKLWRYPNLALWVFLALLAYAWFSMCYLPFSELYTQVYHRTAIEAALRLLPQGLSASLTAITLTFVPKLSQWPRTTMTIGLTLGVVAYILFILAGDPTGMNYWRFVFPSFLLGGMGMHAVFNSINIGVMMALPPSEAGIGGAILQTGMQMGSAIGISIQAGLLTVEPGGYSNLVNVHISWWFVVGWTALSGVVFWGFYRNTPLHETVIAMH